MPPYTEKQHRFFEAVAHGAKPHKGKLSQADAAKMASEGVKKDQAKRKGQRKALEGM